MRGDYARQVAAEQALIACVADPAQLARIIDPHLCHGWAGLAATVWYAAADATTNLDAHLPLLLRALIDHTDKEITSPLPGLIQGHAGVALTLHTIVDAVSSGWPACLLIN